MKSPWNPTRVGAARLHPRASFFFSPGFSSLSRLAAKEKKEKGKKKNRRRCWQAGGLLPLNGNQAITNGEAVEGPFFRCVFVSLCSVLLCFLARHRILGIRLHIRPGHNCLLRTGELLVFPFQVRPPSDFAIRGRGGGVARRRTGGGVFLDQPSHVGCQGNI